jgi:hypothetical protein
VFKYKSRKGAFGCLDMLGCGALVVLKKVLHPMSKYVPLGNLFKMCVQHFN